MEINPPSPGTGHPAYGPEDAKIVRWFLDHTEYNHLMMGRHLTVVYDCDRQADTETATDLAFRPDTRMIHRLYATTPAPWAGRAFMYVYPVAIDDLGRMVAGSRLERAWLEGVPETLSDVLLSAVLDHMPGRA